MDKSHTIHPMSDYDTVLAQVLEILEPFANGKVVHEDTDLVGDLGLDSVRVMQVLLDIEDRFDVSVPLNALPDVRTVKDLVQQLHRLMSQSS